MPTRVFCSSDGFLHLGGGSNDVLDLYTCEGFEKRVVSTAWGARIEERNRIIKQAGSSFIQLIVPEKLSVYPINDSDSRIVFPGHTPTEIIPPGYRLQERIGSQNFLYPIDFLKSQSNHMPIFLPTDSHWTWIGAFCAFQTIMWELRSVYKPNFTTFVHLPKYDLKYRGDLWEPVYANIPLDTFQRVTLPKNVCRVYANSLMGYKEAMNLNNEPGLHTGSHCIFTNDDAEYKQVVAIFGSSFSECRLEPSLLTCILAFYFRTVHFIWSTSVDAEYVRRHNVNLTIAEMPERFLTVCPQDTMQVESFGVNKLKNWKS